MIKKLINSEAFSFVIRCITKTGKFLGFVTLFRKEGACNTLYYKSPSCQGYCVPREPRLTRPS